MTEPTGLDAIRQDHHPECRWPHAMGAPSPGDCAGECVYDCEDCGELWPCLTDLLLAEYDRRGARIASLEGKNTTLGVLRLNAEAGVDAVLALHRRAQPDDRFCVACVPALWPCPTALALGVAS